MQDYLTFIKTKQHSVEYAGFEPLWIPDSMFDFQAHILTEDLRRARAADLLMTGSGKTRISLAFAQNIVLKTNKKVLITTPLAVAFQFIDEAQKIGIDDIEYSKFGKHTKKIVIANYERLHYFDPDDFVCFICDESSILKNFEGSIKQNVTLFMRKMEYRLLATATPSPNDYIELGTSSEALGYLGYIDMLQKFFKNAQSSVDIRHSGSDWYLKPHAKDDFFKWVSTWAITMRKPSDLGFSDKGYDLPKLHERDVMVINDKPLAINGQFQLFAQKAKNFREIKSETKATIEKRIDKVCEVEKDFNCSVFWVNTNEEGDYLEAANKNYVQIKGGMTIEKKEEILMAFANGEIKKLITKPKITAFGLNWQHCNHTTWFPNFSFEQYFQLVRRFYRYGQKDEVFVDRVFSDGQEKILEAVNAKKVQSEDMFEYLVQNANSKYEIEQRSQSNKSIILPSFLVA